MLLAIVLLMFLSVRVELSAYSSLAGCSSAKTCVFALAVFVFLTGCCTNMVAAEDSEDCQNNNYPVEARDVACQVYGWERMRCWWSLGVQYRTLSDIKVSCNISIEFHSKEIYARGWAPCPHLTKKSCYWDEDHFTSPSNTLNISIKIVNERRPEAFVYTNKSFTIAEIVQLDPVNVNYLEIMKTDRPDCQKISWPVTGIAKYKNLTFNITYGCQCKSPTTRSITYLGYTGTAVTMLCGLHPYCGYSGNITGSYLSSQHTPNGLWSDPTPFHFNTDKQVPSCNPLTTAGLYEHILESDGNVRVYWKPLDVCEINSEPTTASYVVTADSHQMVANHPVFYMKVKAKQEPLRVMLQARNDIGNAPGSELVQVYPKHTGGIPSDLIVEFTEGSQDSVSLTIEPRDKTAVNHTVVWCKGDSFCEEPINWRILPLFELRTSLNASKDNRFGLITKYISGANSGIVWERCLYQSGKVPEAPRDVHRSDEQTAEGFRLEWLPYECSQGYIQHYQLTYCPSSPNTDCSCTSEVVHVEVSKHETSHSEKGLAVGSLVCVWLRGVNTAGLGPRSYPVTFTIPATVVSPWVYIGITLAVIVFVIVSTLAVCLMRRLKQRLHHSFQVEDILGDPKNHPLLEKETNISMEVALPTSPDDKEGSSTDSGQSSLGGDPDKTDSLQKQRNSDSAVSSNQDNETAESDEPGLSKPVIDFSAGSEMIEMAKLSSYMKASACSGGGSMNSDSLVGSNESGQDNQSESNGLNRNNEESENITHSNTQDSETQAERRPLLVNDSHISGPLEDTDDDSSNGDFVSNFDDERGESLEYELRDIVEILDE